MNLKYLENLSLYFLHFDIESEDKTTFKLTKDDLTYSELGYIYGIKNLRLNLRIRKNINSDNLRELYYSNKLKNINIIFYDETADKQVVIGLKYNWFINRGSYIEGTITIDDAGTKCLTKYLNI